ncbi:hypothetical protein AB0M32_26015 [Streptomyces sp. NPDC051985]|uniref:hypothetical protein n=1 Tax=Streptomyces sp. NPDC051985 TaxID=3155807 RepID=UPI0034148B14
MTGPDDRGLTAAPAGSLGIRGRGGPGGDRRSDELPLMLSAGARPSGTVPSEEGTGDPARPGTERVWIVDPLHGHFVGQYEWDSCAPAAAGPHVSRLDGSPLRYNAPDPDLPDLPDLPDPPDPPDLLIWRPEQAEAVLDALRAAPDAPPTARS